MIETTDLVERIENDLNALLPSDSDLAFKIWANVGEHTPPERNGNKVKYLIEGIIKTNSSSMEANKVLSIGVNGFALEFMIPLRIPRTSLGKDIAELQTIQNGQFVFPAFIIGTLSQYFQKSKAWTITKNENGANINYAVGIMGGVALPGDVDIKAFSGNSLPVSVYITANIVEGGTVSTEVAVKINGKTIPAQVITPSRAAVLNNDVLSNFLESKSIATSSAFALQVQFPANDYAGTKEIIDFLMHGTINRAYFVEIQWDKTTYNLFMLIARANGAAEGVTMAGLTAELIEIMQYTELIGVPNEYQVGKFVLNSSQATAITFKLAGKDIRKAYVGGNTLLLTPIIPRTINITPDDIIDEGDHYAVYLITDKACTITNSNYSFEIVKAGTN